MATITVQPLSAHPHHVLMTWEQHILINDVREAFRSILQMLNEADHPVFVVVDIRSNPRFPVTQTIAEAIEPYRHERAIGWLIVGHNLLARSIERVLAAITQRHVVTWFADLESAINHIENHQRA